MKKVFLLMIGLLLLNSAFAVRECVYDPRGFTFHCSNNMPGTSIGPGQEGEITIVCCFTSQEYQNSDETLSINAEVVYNWTHRIQDQDGTWNENTAQYPASYFITNITFPEESKGFETFPVTIHFSLPEESDFYEPGAVIDSRVDIKVITGKGVVPNNAVYPQIRIPNDWSPKSISLTPVIAGGGILVLVSSLGVTLVKKKNKRSRMNQAKRLDENKKA